MDSINFINPRRLSWCLDDFGIGLEELAAEAKMSVSTLDRAMSGEGGLTFKQLQKLAAFFGRGILFFLESADIDQSVLRTPQFRTLANQKPDLSVNVKKLIERTEYQRGIYLDLLKEISPDEAVVFDAPDFGNRGLADAAAFARRWLNLTEQNTFDTYRAAVEAKGILVFRTNGYAGKWQIAKENPVLGFSLYDPICPVIVVKKQASDNRQSFTLMHELAHILVHKKSSIDDDSDLKNHQGVESEANKFASMLLLPEEFLRQIAVDNLPEDASLLDEWLKPYRTRWGVSNDVILIRLLSSNILSQGIYQSYRKWWASRPVAEEAGGTRMYRHREPKHIFGDPFVKTVLTALNLQTITLNKASKYLDGINLKDLKQLGRHYADI